MICYKCKSRTRVRGYECFGGRPLCKKCADEIGIIGEVGDFDITFITLCVLLFGIISMVCFLAVLCN